MVLLVSPWHSFEHTQYSTLGFTPKSQNRANVVAELRQLTYSIIKEQTSAKGFSCFLEWCRLLRFCLSTLKEFSHSLSDSKQY